VRWTSYGLTTRAVNVERFAECKDGVEFEKIPALSNTAITTSQNAKKEKKKGGGGGLLPLQPQIYT
jgi:hypothetical protein